MMRAVIVALAAFTCSTCVQQEPSKAQDQIPTWVWPSTSAHVVAAVQKHLHLECVFTVHARSDDSGKFPPVCSRNAELTRDTAAGGMPRDHKMCLFHFTQLSI